MDFSIFEEEPTVKKFFLVIFLLGFLIVLSVACAPSPNVAPLNFRVGFFLKDMDGSPYFLFARSNYWYPPSYRVFSNMKCWTDIMTYKLGVTRVVLQKTQKFSGHCKEDRYYDIYIPVPILYNDYFYLLGLDNTAPGPFYLRDVTGESFGNAWYKIGWKIWDSEDAIVPGIVIGRIPFLLQVKNGELITNLKNFLFPNAGDGKRYSLSCDSLPSSEGYFVFDRVNGKWYFISKNKSKYEFWTLTFTESTTNEFRCCAKKLNYLPVTDTEDFSHAFIANDYFAGEVTATLRDVWIKIFKLDNDKGGHYIHFILSETSDTRDKGWCSFLSEFIPLKTGLLFIFSIGDFCEGNPNTRGMGVGSYFVKFNDLPHLTEVEVYKPPYLLFVNREMGGGIVVSGDTIFVTGVKNEGLSPESVFLGSYRNPPSWVAYILSGRFDQVTQKFNFSQLKKFSLLR